MAQGARPPLGELQDAFCTPLPPATPSCASAPALPGVVEAQTQQQQSPPPRVPCVPPPPDDDDEDLLPQPPFLQQPQARQQQLSGAPPFMGGLPSAAEAGVAGYDPAIAAAWKEQQQQYYHQQVQQQPPPQQQPPQQQQQQPMALAQKPYMDAERHLHPLLEDLFEQGVGCVGRHHGGYHHINVKAATRLLEAGCNVEIWLYKGAHSHKSKREEGKAANDKLGAGDVWGVLLHELHADGYFKHINKWTSLRAIHTHLAVNQEDRQQIPHGQTRDVDSLQGHELVHAERVGNLPEPLLHKDSLLGPGGVELHAFR